MQHRTFPPPRQQQQQPSPLVYGNQYPQQQEYHPQYPPQQHCAPQYPPPPNQRQQAPSQFNQHYPPPPMQYSHQSQHQQTPQYPQKYPQQYQHQPVGPRPSPPPLRAPQQSSYESQAARWKQGFRPAGTTTGSCSSGSSSTRSSDLEAPLIAELCSSLGASSFPPRDPLQRFLRHVGSMDHEYICHLLNEKLDDPIWQVQGKALSVLDSLLKSSSKDFFLTYYSQRLGIFEKLRHSRKELLKSRAEKIFRILERVPQEPPLIEETVYTRTDSSQVQNGTARCSTSPTHSPPYTSQSAAVQPTCSTTSVQQSTVSQRQPQSQNDALQEAPAMPIPTPSPIEAPAPPSSSVLPSAFSFLSDPPLSPPPHLALPLPSTTHTQPKQDIPATHTDVFGSSLLVPVAGAAVGAAPVAPEQSGRSEEAAPEPVDPIHDAFEGLSVSEQPAGGEGNDDSNEAMQSSNCVFTPQKCTDPIREVLLDVDLPPGPMGLVLDATIPEMAVVERFVPLPDGSVGYLELHPAICPGCALVGVNGINVGEMPLSDVGPVLATYLAVPKALRFKKLLSFGRVVNPFTLEVPYVPPSIETESPRSSSASSPMDSPSKSQSSRTHCVNTAECNFMDKLMVLEKGLDEVEREVELAEERRNAKVPHPVGFKNRLAQMNGDVDRITTKGIDSVILGPDPPDNHEEIRAFRSSLVRRADALMKRIHDLAKQIDDDDALNCTSASPLPSPITPIAVPLHAAISSSPQQSGFGFLAGGSDLSSPASSASPIRPPPTSHSPQQSAFQFLGRSSQQSIATTALSSSPPTQFEFMRSASGSMESGKDSLSLGGDANLPGPPAPTPLPQASASPLAIESSVQIVDTKDSGVHLVDGTPSASTPPESAASASAFSFLAV